MMALSPEALRQLIQYVVSEVIDQGGEIWLTRLAKLLYLIDVEYYRGFGKTLTGLHWIKYYYGPYVRELPDLARRSGCDLGDEELPSARRGTKVWVHPPENLDRALSFSAKAAVDRVLKHWALESLDIVLDYVYLETEPMKSAELFKPLDFTAIQVGKRPLSRIAPLKLSPDDSKQVKRNLAARKADEARLARNPETSSEVARVLAALEDEAQVQNLTGSVRFPEDAFKGTDYQE